MIFFKTRTAQIVSIFILSIGTFLFCVTGVCATEGDKNKTLIIYYSYTGNTQAACESLQKSLGVDIREIKDLKNDPGNVTMGGGKSMMGGKQSMEKSEGMPPMGSMGTKLVMDTEINPATINLSAYSHIILGSPIWMGSLSPAMIRFLATNNLTGKKVVIITTTNASEKEEQRKKHKESVEQAGGKVVASYQVLAMDKLDGKKVMRSKEEIARDLIQFVSEIKSLLNK
jgi:flavodoxin